MVSLAALVIMSSMTVGQAEQIDPTKALQPLLGTWSAEIVADDPIPGFVEKGDKFLVKLTYTPAKNGKAVVVCADITANGKTVDFTDGFITWDPREKSLVGMDSYATGGMARYLMTVDGNKIMWKFTGVTADGTPTSESLTATPSGKDTFKLESTARSEGEKKLSDQVVTLRRVTK